MKFKVLFLFVLAFNVNSKDLTPSERMLNAMGISEVLDQTKTIQTEAAKEQVAIIMKQLDGTISRLPAEDKKELELLFSNMLIEVANSWSTEKAIEIYSKAWSDNYSEQEILAIAEKYEEPEAKQELDMLLKASEQLNNYIMGQYNKSLEEVMSKALPKMRVIIQEGLAKNTPNKRLWRQ